jgi:hypothetical protein
MRRDRFAEHAKLRRVTRTKGRAARRVLPAHLDTPPRSRFRSTPVRPPSSTRVRTVSRTSVGPTPWTCAGRRRDLQVVFYERLIFFRKPDRSGNASRMIGSVRTRQASSGQRRRRLLISLEFDSGSDLRWSPATNTSVLTARRTMVEIVVSEHQLACLKAAVPKGSIEYAALEAAEYFARAMRSLQGPSPSRSRAPRPSHSSCSPSRARRAPMSPQDSRGDRPADALGLPKTMTEERDTDERLWHPGSASTASCA